MLEAVQEEIEAYLSTPTAYGWEALLQAKEAFGVFQNGSIKVRGIEARRHDTAPFIVETQMKVLEILAKAPDTDYLPDFLPQVFDYIGRRLHDLMKSVFRSMNC